MKKLMSKKGFTLMEMLIVVAIIAILVAIAIPTFNSALNKAKFGTDQANLRSLKAMIMVDYIANSASFTDEYYYTLSADADTYAGTAGAPSGGYAYKYGTGYVSYTYASSGSTFTANYTAPTGMALQTQVASFKLGAIN